MTKLLPCPFCGGKPHYSVARDGWGNSLVSCLKCGASCEGEAPCAGGFSKKPTAEQKWNKRTKKAMPQPKSPKIVYIDVGFFEVMADARKMVMKRKLDIQQLIVGLYKKFSKKFGLDEVRQAVITMLDEGELDLDKDNFLTVK